MDDPSLSMFKAKSDAFLSSLVWWKMSLSLAGFKARLDGALSNPGLVEDVPAPGREVGTR